MIDKSSSNIIKVEIVSQDFFRLLYSFQQPTITSDIQTNQSKETFCYLIGNKPLKLVTFMILFLILVLIFCIPPFFSLFCIFLFFIHGVHKYFFLFNIMFKGIITTLKCPLNSEIDRC